MKNKNAVALGRRGGKAKNAKMTDNERIAHMERMRERLAAKRVSSNHMQPPKRHCPTCQVTVPHEHI